jgi:hypothetical protein
VKETRVEGKVYKPRKSGLNKSSDVSPSCSRLGIPFPGITSGSGEEASLSGEQKTPLKKPNAKIVTLAKLNIF